MATSIAWTDESGSVTLTNGKPVPGDRLAGWLPMARTIGPEGGNPVALGSGITYGWEHRVDFGVKFSLEYIPQTSLRDVQRLILWLLRGETSSNGGEGVVTLNTGDQVGNSYNCRIWPGSTPELEQMDRNQIEYRLTLELLNTAQDFMVCGYDEQVS
ncbi:MAG: hypothetical protein OEW44_07045 [Gemmatimonadota bacterium]|nr:hypothetical protein [Gemmatimonadota bacterium]